MYLLGIDIGTSSCKAALFDENGAPVTQAVHDYPIFYPASGMAEQNPDDWWSAACMCIREMLEEPSISPADISGIGISGQSWSAIAIDGSGSVLCPTPIWTDTRAHKQCKDILSLIPAEDLFSLCGNPLSPGYSLPKILWYKDNNPDLYKNAVYILQSNSFIAYRLTGVISQDLSQGYGYSCFDIRRGKWATELAEDIGIRPSLLPPLSASHEIIGKVSKTASSLTGLIEGTPVAAGGLDAACASLGAGVIDKGQTQEQGGQAGGMSICLDTFSAHEKLISSCHVVPGRWLLQGGTTGGGGALRWLRDVFYPNLSFEEMSAQAETISPGSEGVIFLPYMSGERSPLWDPYAKGVFFGLDYGKTRAHVIRAVMEGVAYSLRHNLDTASQAGVEAGMLRTVGGSSKSPVWTQIKADVTGKSIEAVSGDTAAALGAAILAGVGTKVYPSFSEGVKKTVRVSRTHIPDVTHTQTYGSAYETYLKLYESLQPVMRPEQ